MHDSRGLIFDIGLHTKEDSAYYLHLGYSVVGVEANPLLAADCAVRFEREIAEGRMKILNAGVLATPDEFVFYRNLTDDGHSSFKVEMGTRGGKFEEMSVLCVTVDQLIREHGKPLFMKIDTEGADLQVLGSLKAETAPFYLSSELSNFTDPILERLVDLGYAGFKFVNGATVTPRRYSTTTSAGDCSARWVCFFRPCETRLDPRNASGQRKRNGSQLKNIAPMAMLSRYIALGPLANRQPENGSRRPLPSDGSGHSASNTEGQGKKRSFGTISMRGEVTHEKQSKASSLTD